MEKLKLIKCCKTLLLLISMSLVSGRLFAQDPTITGKVVDEKGLALIGATVKLKGAQGATVTDVNGNFAIGLPSAINTLTISYVGYFTKDVAVGPNSRNIQVTLLPDANNLNEVVVIGYGAQRKRDITGSTANVSEATLNETPAANIPAELKGHTPGVDIQSNSATPGGGGQIRIRGDRAFTNNASSEGNSNADALNQPLIVLDGIPFGGSLNDLDPDNVASLEILKDASATAIYGSRGSNGVILVTTKRGRAGKAIVSYNAYYGFTNILSELKVYNGQQYAQLKADAAAGNSQTPGLAVYPLTAAEQAGLTAGTSTDWQKLIYKQGRTSDQNLSLSGGTESTQYGMGAGYYVEDGIIPNQRFERYSLRTTIDHKLNDHIRIGINSQNTLVYNNTPGGAGVTSTLLKLSPLVSPRNPDGSLNLFPLAGSIDAAVYVNPLTLIDNPRTVYANGRRLRTFNSLYGEVKFLKYLTYRVNLGLDFTQDKNGSYNGPNTFTNSNTTAAGSNASISNAEAYTYTFENILTFDKTFAKKHKVTFTGLYSAQKDHFQSSGFTAQGIPFDYLQNNNFAYAASISPQNGNYSERGLLSYMGRLNYSYDGRYALTATVRQDGASVLAPGHQYFVYPALGLAWNVTKENWMKGIDVIDNLKIRGGYGITGNQGTNPYQTLGALGSGTLNTYNFGTTTAGQQNGSIVNTLANTNLHWQSTAEFDLGVDFGILKDRITGAVDVYSEKTKDILANNILPSSLGASSQISNLGKSKGSGLEISLSTINIQNRTGLTWTTDFNFSFNRSAITYLPNGVLKDVNNGLFVGQPFSVIYDYKKLGIWQTGDPNLAKQTSPTELPGQIRVQDVDGDGKINANDLQIIGNFQPKWIGGLTNRFSYKGLDVSITMYARMGQMVAAPYLSTDAASNGFGFFLQGRTNQVVVDYWTPNNPTNAFPRPDASVSGPRFGSTLQYVDGSFIKCRSINLGYNIPSKLLSRAGINSFRIYVTALNPFILYSPFVKNGYGPDPEGNGSGGIVTSQSGVLAVPGQVVNVNANNPATRSFNLGVNLKF
ncbi:MAG: TonB-dependent receptor [Bacteroidota bacterium]|nr:TonB-dependent receptor [Bacteroidota bacterium]